MVDASERAFRILCREHGADLAFTPMLNARLMTNEPKYAARHFDPGGEGDRPLAAQLAGHDPHELAAAASLCEAGADLIDLNLGCPQEIARTGRYGAFLLEDEPELALRCLRALCAATERPVTAKMRLQSSLPRTVELAQRMQDIGVVALTVHGRTRFETRRLRGVGTADWDAIGAVVSALDIPVVANGSIARASCMEACLQHTGAAAVMTAEALLENPALFVANKAPAAARGGEVAYLDQDALAARYLELCAHHPPPKGIAVVKDHLRRMLYGGLRQWPDLDDALFVASDWAGVACVARRLAERGWMQPRFHTECERPRQSWYARGRSVDAGAEVLDVECLETSRWRDRYLARSSAKRHGAARKQLARMRQGCY